MENAATKTPLEQVLEGKWNQFTGKVKETWGQLTNDDVSRAEGKLENLIGIIQERTGEQRNDIQQRIQDIADNIKNNI